MCQHGAHGEESSAVTVVFDAESTESPESDIEQVWRQWDPGVELRVIRTEYASIVRPILRLVDELREDEDRQLVVLIPVVIPDRIRQRLLHNQVDLLLASKLHDRPDVVVARVPFPIRTAREIAEQEAADGTAE